MNTLGGHGLQGLFKTRTLNAMRTLSHLLLPALFFSFLLTSHAEPTPLTLSWTNHILSVHGAHLPGGKIDTWYLEAYCRPGSTDRVWHETTIGHKTERVSAAADGSHLHLRCTVEDGVIVDHHIRVGDATKPDEAGEISFDIRARNPTKKRSEAHWAQPCIRVGQFTGLHVPDTTTNKYDYIKRCFVFQNGKPAFMPTAGWGTEARYTPGQVWVPHTVDRDDANPRPHNKHAPSNGLIGCVSADEKWLFAVAFDPFQELFQGVIECIHSDFRIGGLAPGETQKIRGRMYVLPNGDQDKGKGLANLEARYRADFPTQSWTGWTEREDYRAVDLEGWTCLLHPDFEKDQELWKTVRIEIVRQLRAIKKALPAKAVATLQKQNIWIEDKHPKHLCMCYHSSKKWLRENHMNPEKAGHVELANGPNFLDWCKVGQPWMLLHEFAHGYHDLELGWDDERIDQAYRAALAKGLYGRVDTYRTAETGRQTVHYGSTNNKEYFAEATEAYFGKNDFFPFTREQLRNYDPAAFAMVEATWGVRDSVKPAAPDSP